jgi:hypothetical protein
VRERAPSVPPPPLKQSVPPPRAGSIPPPGPSVPPRGAATVPPVSSGAARERLDSKLRVAQALAQSLPPGHVQGRLLQIAILRRDESLLDGVLASLGALGKSVPPAR